MHMKVIDRYLNGCLLIQLVIEMSYHKYTELNS